MNSRLFKLNRLIFTILTLFILSEVHAKPPELTPKEAHKKAEEILKAHVTYKELTPELSGRIVQNFLEELDPTKTYLTEKEIITWINPSDELKNQLTEDFNKKSFTAFEEIYSVMVRAIERRNQLEEKILKREPPKAGKSSEFKDLSWAKSEEELEERLLTIRGFQLDAADKLNLETQDQFFQRVTKRRLSREQEILQNKGKEAQKKQLLAYYLKAFTAALDNHTAYFTPTEANQFMAQVQQRFFGIGAQLKDNLNGFTIVRLIEGGPALRDGTIKAEDRIIAVNHEPVVGMYIGDVIERIHGPKGTKVHLTFLRDHKDREASEKYEVEIVRDEIVLKETRFSSESIPFGDGVIAHIHLYSFYQDSNDSSASDVKKAIEEIMQNHKLYGVILDLRNNGGGILLQAPEVTGNFIQKGIVVSIKDNNGNLQHLRNFNATPTWEGPLVVLTNKISASAAEIVAGSLQDYGRALLVGDETTFGKGTHQLFTLESAHTGKANPQGEYKVTRGLYYTVSGKSPQFNGTKVDITVPGVFSQAEIGESYSKYPLENDEVSPNFVDNLNDIHPFHRNKMMRVYKQGRQEKVDLYAPYLETLKKNSTERIAANKNYQTFIQELSKKDDSESEPQELYGQSDLQLEEATAIMKDLIFLTQSSQLQQKAS